MSRRWEPVDEDDVVMEEEYDSDVDFVEKAKVLPSAVVKKLKETAGDDDLFAVEEKEEGECFMAVKPWLGAIVPPSKPPASNPTEPDQRLEMEWVYGYTCQDIRGNVYYNTKGHIIYPSAAVVITYDAQAHKQSFYLGHNDDVCCMAQNPTNLDIVATGQVATVVDGHATNPHICVYNTVTKEEWRLPNLHKRKVQAVGFSFDGKLLGSVGADNDYTVMVWDWKNKRKLAEMSADKSKVFDLVWDNDEGDKFLTVGDKHVVFWQYKNGALTKNGAKFGATFPKQTFVSACYTVKGFPLVGAKDGSVYLFMPGETESMYARMVFPNICDGPVQYMLPYAENDTGVIVGGHKDGRVSVLNSKLQVVKDVNLGAGAVIAVAKKGKDLVCGTIKGELHQVTDCFGSGNSKMLLRGHHEGELWGLGTHPTDSKVFVTVGEDNKILVFDANSHRLINSGIISDKAGDKTYRRGNGASTTSSLPDFNCCRTASFSPDGRHLAMGLNSGEVVVVDFRTLKRVAEFDLNSFGKRNVTDQKGNWIQCMSYSPNGKTLAVGTHGMIIMLLDATDGYKPKGKLDKHNSALIKLDWSEDSRFIQSNCLGYELLFFEVDQSNLTKSKQIPQSSALRDVRWATQSCLFGWSVQGVYDPNMDGSDVNCVDRDKGYRLIATGDDFSNVNIYRYPVDKVGNKKRSYRGHSSHVTSVRFSPDDKYLFSVGGGDQTAIQWKVLGN